MRKILIGFIAIVTFMVVGILVVPGMIDWNDYKADITSQVENATGRRLTITGDISLTVLPAPVVNISNVAFANLAGSNDPYMAKLETLEVRVALLPLLSGTIQVEKIRLVDPVIILEILPDGQKNWELDIPSATDGGQNLSTAPSEQTGSSSPVSGPGVQLDNFELINATVIYRDAPGGTEETINAINATFRMGSLQGPFISEGSLVARNTPLSFNIGVDGIYQGRTAPVKAEIKLADGLLTMAISGDLTNLDANPKFTGKTRIQGASLASIVAALAPGTHLPGPLREALDIQGNITGSSLGLAIDDVKIRLGEITGTAKLETEFPEKTSDKTSDKITASLTVQIDHINLDTILGSTQPVSPTVSKKQTERTQNSQSDSGANQAATIPPFTLPDTINGALSILVDSITYNGQRSREIIINGELNHGEITLSQLSAHLPGTTEFSLFGFASVNDGILEFEGDSELSIADGHKLGNWLGLDLAMVSRSTLKNIKARTTIMAGLLPGKQTAQLKKIDLRFDKSRLAGEVALDLQERLVLDISLSLDRFNLNDYLETGKVSTPDAGSPSASVNSAAETSTPSATNNPLAMLSSLTGFDGALKLRVGEFVFDNSKARNIVLDATLRNNQLTINKSQIGDLEGARIAVSGTLNALHKMPRFHNLELDFKAKSVDRLARALDITLPIPATSIGAVNLNTVLNGPPLQPTIKTRLTALGATLSLAGKLSTLPTHPLIDLDIALKHGNLAKLIRLSGADYRPSGKIGGIDVSLHAKGGATSLELTGLKGTTGTINFNGTTAISLNDTRPKFVAVLNTGPVVIDPYIPAGKKASPPANKPSSTSSSTPAPSGVPWSRENIDLSDLHNFDADITIKLATLRHEKTELNNAEISATLDKGILDIRQVSAKLFGGQVNLSALLNAQNTPQVKSTVSVENIQIKNMLTALADKNIATGTLSLKSTISSTGSSVSDLVASLNGSGSFDARGIDVKGSAKGTPLAGILGIVRGLGQIGSGLSGNSPSSLADASGSFVLNGGVATLQNMILQSGLGNGELEGYVDLPRWQLDVNGTMHMASNVLTQVLSLNTGILQDFPFSVSGSIDDPTIKFTTGSRAGTNPAIPLVGEVPVIGTVLEGLLGGVLGGKITSQPQPQIQPPAPKIQQRDPSQPPPPPPSQQPQPQQQQELDPAKLLQNLLKF